MLPRTTVLLVTLLVALAGCTRPVAELTPEERARMEARKPLVGTWSWMRGETAGGFSGTTPAEAGYFEQLTFHADGTLEVVQNSNPRARIRFDVTRVTYPDGRLSEPRLFMTGLPSATFHIEGATLTIRELNGGATRIYRRLS